MTRLLDILLSGLALLIMAPLLVPLTIVLRLSGEGEVFFVQKRVGKGGGDFDLYKFATMLKDSPNTGTGTVTLKDDLRILPLGHFLRRAKINELPQLLNIFMGDMSLIGPRPQTRRCFNAFPLQSQQAITTLRPGLSGIGSIVFRGEDKMLDGTTNSDHFYDRVIMPYKGALEEWYVSRRGMATYLLLVILTAWVILFPGSSAVWRALPDLPTPPDELKAYINYPRQASNE